MDSIQLLSYKKSTSDFHLFIFMLALYHHQSLSFCIQYIHTSSQQQEANHLKLLCVANARGVKLLLLIFPSSSLLLFHTTILVYCFFPLRIIWYHLEFLLFVCCLWNKFVYLCFFFVWLLMFFLRLIAGIKAFFKLFDIDLAIISLYRLLVSTSY